MPNKTIQEMDTQADKLIAGWSFGSLVANLLPPPFDTIAVGSAFAKMGYDLSKVYEIPMSMSELKPMGKTIAKAIAGVSLAAWVGTGIFKWIPGVNIWVALLLQPPIVAAIAYSAGTAFKQYYHFRITNGRDLTDEELRIITQKALRDKIGK